MWAYLSGYDVTSTTDPGLNLARMVAKVDIQLAGLLTPDKFTLEQVRVYNYMKQGSLIPDLSTPLSASYWHNVSNSTLGVGQEPTVVAGTKAAKPTSAADVGGGEFISYAAPKILDQNKLRGEIYLFESEAGYAPDDASGAWIDNTCLVIGGKWNGDGAVSWYRVDFVELNSSTGDKEFIPLLRNNSYTLTIESVKARGEDTAEKALYSESNGMNSKILEWNDHELGDVWYSGEHHFGIVSVYGGISGQQRSTDLLFSPYGDEQIVVTFDTDIPDFEMYLDLDVDPAPMGDGMSDLTTDGQPARMVAGASSAAFSSAPPKKYYSYELKRVGVVGDSYRYELIVNSLENNITPEYNSNINNRPQYWVIVAENLRVPLKVNQQWTSFYISAADGSKMTYYPEGTQLTVDDSNLPGIRIASPDEVACFINSDDGGTDDPDWFGVRVLSGDLTSKTSGYYRADVVFDIDYYDLGGSYSGDRSATLTFEVKSDPVHKFYTYTITQQEPFLIIGDGTPPYYTTKVVRSTTNQYKDIYVGTNIHPDHLDLDRRDNDPDDSEYDAQGRIRLFDPSAPFISGADANQRNRIFRVEVDFSDPATMPPGEFSAFFDASANNIHGDKHDYGLDPTTAKVLVGIDNPELFMTWYMSTFLGDDTPDWNPSSPLSPAPVSRYTDTSGDGVAPAYTFPWNVRKIDFDISTKGGEPEEDATVSMLSGTIPHYSGGVYDVVSFHYRYAYGLTIDENDYRDEDSYVIAYNLSENSFATPKRLSFKVGKQAFSALPADLSVDFKGYGYSYPPSASPQAGNPYYIPVTSNVRWSVTMANNSAAGTSTDWLKLQLRDTNPTTAQLTDYAPYFVVGTKLLDESSVLGNPVANANSTTSYTSATGNSLVKQARLYVALDTLQLNSTKWGTNASTGYRRSADLVFTNEDAAANGGTGLVLNASTPSGGNTVKITQFVPRLEYASGAPAYGSYPAVLEPANTLSTSTNDVRFRIGANTNLSGWGVRIYEIDSTTWKRRSPTSPIYQKAYTGATSASAAASMLVLDIDVPTNSTSKHRYLEFALYCTEFTDNTATSTVRENEVIFPQINTYPIGSHGTRSQLPPGIWKQRQYTVTTSHYSDWGKTSIRAGSGSTISSTTSTSATTMAYVGQTVNLTATANGAGRVFIGWVVTSGTSITSPNVTLMTGSSVSEANMSGLHKMWYGSTSSAFTMPADNVTIEAVFAGDKLLVGSTTWAPTNMYDAGSGNTANNIFCNS